MRLHHKLKNIGFFSIAIVLLTIATIASSCKKESTQITDTGPCFNGGIYLNDSCYCPEGYKGLTCAEQITPQKMTVSKIKIVRFPQKNGGAKWDETSGPDIYVNISLGSTIIHKQPTSFQDANSDLIYVYKPTTPFDLSDITSKYSISLFDNDSGSPDELMASIYFTPYLVSRGFPKFLYLDRGGDVAFLLTVEYEW